MYDLTFTEGDVTFFRKSTPTETIFSLIVHEGTHVMPNLDGVIMTTIQEEKICFFFDYQFQIAVGMEPEFKTINEMLDFINNNYQ